MPGGRDHNIINFFVLISTLSSLYVLSEMYEDLILKEYMDLKIVLIFSLSYLFGTFFLSPDLDIDSSAYERWGLLKVLWWPYKILFKHRGLSHHPVFGPLTILTNFGIIIVILLVLAGYSLFMIPVDILFIIIPGLVLSIEIHILVDMISSEID